MAGNKYAVGDLVQLKSGGPAMTVVSVASDGVHVLTKWFAGAKSESSNFPMDALQPFTPAAAAKK